MRKFRANSGSKDAGAVVSYKNEEKVIVKKATKHDYSTYEKQAVTGNIHPVKEFFPACSCIKNS